MQETRYKQILKINKQSFRWVVFVFILLCLPISVAAQESLHSYIEKAVDHNPNIQQAYHKWKTAEYKIKSAKSLDDPVASYGYFGEEVQTRVGPQKQKYGLAQKIPFPGKRRLKGKVQSKQAQIFKEQYEAVKNEIIKDIKFVYYDLFWVDKAVEINEEEKAILEKLEKVAQRKYESNLVPQQDVIKAQVELSNIIRKLFLFKQNRQSLAARMNSLLNRKPNVIIAKITEAEYQDFIYTMEDVVNKAQNSRQELMAADFFVERAVYEKSLARMNYFPDFTLGAEFIEIGGGTTTSIDDGQDAWLAKVSVNVPIWFGKLKALFNEKTSSLKAAQESQKGVRNQITFEAQDMYFKITTYRDIISLYETALMPQAQQAFDSSQTGFETGNISFLDWLDTERTYLQTRLAYYKAVVDYHKSIAYLERIVGEKL